MSRWSLTRRDLLERRAVFAALVTGPLPDTRMISAFRGRGRHTATYSPDSEAQ